MECPLKLEFELETLEKPELTQYLNPTWLLLQEVDQADFTIYNSSLFIFLFIHIKADQQFFLAFCQQTC